MLHFKSLPRCSIAGGGSLVHALANQKRRSVERKFRPGPSLSLARLLCRLRESPAAIRGPCCVAANTKIIPAGLREPRAQIWRVSLRAAVQSGTPAAGGYASPAIFLPGTVGSADSSRRSGSLFGSATADLWSPLETARGPGSRNAERRGKCRRRRVFPGWIPLSCTPPCFGCCGIHGFSALQVAGSRRPNPTLAEFCAPASPARRLLRSICDIC